VQASKKKLKIELNHSTKKQLSESVALLWLLLGRTQKPHSPVLHLLQGAQQQLASAFILSLVQCFYLFGPPKPKPFGLLISWFALV